MAQSKPSAPAQPTQLRPEELWRYEVQNWYPNLLHTTHCLPPVHFNLVGYTAEPLAAGQEFLVQNPPADGASAQPAPQTGREVSKVQESDVRDDIAQTNIVARLTALGDSRKPDAMFIISKLKFTKFFTCSASHPSSKPRDGDFDILLIHKSGILIGEIKSVGQKNVMKNQSDADDAEVGKRVNKAIRQLNRGEKVIKQDTGTGLRLKKTVMLPYVHRTQLKRILQFDPKLAKGLRQCLSAKDTEEAAQLCLCSDDISDLSKLKAWFEGRMCPEADCLMTDEAYLDLIAKFGGSATVIEVPFVSYPRLQVHTVVPRTKADGIYYTGERFAKIVLTPKQCKILHKAPKNVCLSGPPGTGKTIALVVQGIVWLKKGHDVYVLSCNRDSRSAAHMVHSQLKDLPECVKQPKLQFYDFETDIIDDVENALTKFKTRAASGKKIRIIADECNYEHMYIDRYKRFFREMETSVQDVCMWVSSLGNTGTPEVLERFAMKTPLRCPPVVARQVKPGVDWCSSTLKLCGSYTESSCPAPCEGMPVIWFTHSGERHSGQWPAECAQCGEDVANKLRELGVGDTGNVVSAGGPPKLRYLDVAIITRSSLTAATSPPAAGDQPADCGFVVGIRSGAIPVRVLPYVSSDRPVLDDAVKDFATAFVDEVTVVHPFLMNGLERKVVVVLPGRDPDIEHDDEEWALRDRLHAMSRCTSQLMIIQCPGHPLQETAV